MRFTNDTETAQIPRKSPMAFSRFYLNRVFEVTAVILPCHIVALNTIMTFLNMGEYKVMAKESILKKIQQLKRKLATKYHVNSIGVFGSVIRNEATPESDIDVLVEFSEKADLLDLVGLSIFLEEQLGRPVDVVSLGGLREELKKYVLPEVVYI